MCHTFVSHTNRPFRDKNWATERKHAQWKTKEKKYKVFLQNDVKDKCASLLCHSSGPIPASYLFPPSPLYVSPAVISRNSQGCPTFFPLEHDWKLLEHKGLKPKASLRREAPIEGGWGGGNPLPQVGVRGFSPWKFLENCLKMVHSGVFLEQLLQSSKPKI